MAEVEIFSLLEEQIPKYKVRADSMTQFGGYGNEDWFIPFPALAVPPDGLGLSKDMCRETLNYFREYLYLLGDQIGIGKTKLTEDGKQLDIQANAGK